MVTFRLSIDLGNSEMRTTNDIAQCLISISEKIHDKDINEFVLYKTIFDINCNDVGRCGIKNKNGDTPKYPIDFNEE